jgi:hypothetical protein
MSEETRAAIIRCAELREVIAEGLALIAERAARIAEARAELAGEGSAYLFDPDIYYDPHFGRAVADLAYAAQVAKRLCPIQE